MRTKLTLFMGFFFLVIMLSSVSAITICNPNLPGGCPEDVISITASVNYSAIGVNDTFYWQGYTPATLPHSILDELAWSVAGHTIDTNLDMNSHNIYEIDKTYFSATDFISSDDDDHIDIHSDRIDLFGEVFTTKNITMNADNRAFNFGTQRDASFTYNGSDVLFNPKLVGAGKFIVLGDIMANDVTPITTDTYSLGSSALRWLKGWFSGLDVSGDINQTNGNATINNYYGEVWFHNDEGEAVGTLNATYQILNVFSLEESENMLNGFANTSEGLQLITEGGVYRAKWEATGSGTNNHFYHGCLFVNDDCPYTTNQHVIADANNQVRMAKTGFIRINNGDNITIRIKDTEGTSAGTVYIASMSLDRIGN